MPPVKLKRGGARNRADRVSWQLNERQCRMLIERSLATAELGNGLNRFVTIAWGMAGVADHQAVTMTGHFISLARDWMRSHGFAMPWVWVQERGHRFGQHVHILLHVPAELDQLFRPMPMRWVKSLLDGPYLKGTIQSQRLASAYSPEGYRAAYQAELLGKLHYMLKCSPEALERPLGMEGWGYKPWGQSSRVIGKRAGVWQNRGKG